MSEKAKPEIVEINNHIRKLVSIFSSCGINPSMSAEEARREILVMFPEYIWSLTASEEYIGVALEHLQLQKTKKTIENILAKYGNKHVQDIDFSGITVEDVQEAYHFVKAEAGAVDNRRLFKNLPLAALFMVVLFALSLGLQTTEARYFVNFMITGTVVYLLYMAIRVAGGQNKMVKLEDEIGELVGSSEELAKLLDDIEDSNNILYSWPSYHHPRLVDEFNNDYDDLSEANSFEIQNNHGLNIES